MKTHRYVAGGLVVTTALLLAGATRIQATPNFVVAAFATGTQGQPNGGQYGGDDISVPYGAGTIVWDGVTYDAADGSTGAAYITANFSSANNTDLLVSMGPDYNNWFYEGPGPSCPTGTVDFTQYHAVQFDIMWDTNSSLTIAQFNTGDNWPSNYLVAGAGSNYMATNSYYTDGVNVSLFTGSGGTTVYLGTFQIPANADKGWQTVTMPYSDSLGGISSGAGLWFQGSFGGGAGINGGPYTASFWIDNLQLVGNTTVAAPPTVSGPTKAAPGLNVFNASVGTGNNYYDRNEVIAKTTSGLSWVGNTPASYSFTLTGFPKGLAYSGEAYLILVPNSLYEDNAADYNESNAMIVEIQSKPTGGQVSLSFKTNEPASETYTPVSFTSYTGPSAPTNPPGTSVSTSQILGTYTLTFTGNDAGTLMAPDGTTGTFSLPTNTAENYFAETGNQAYNFLMYLGGQANDVSFIDKSVAYGSITVTGPPSGGQVTENFISDANSASPLQNWGATWTGGSTTDPSAVVLVPTNAPYWIDWSSPASGFVLAASPSLSPATWQNVSTYAPIAMYGSNAQLVSVNDLNSTNAEFFSMVARTASQLLVLLPGQTNTPGVAPGYTGTPTPVSLSDNDGQETITVLAVDANWNPVGGLTDQITISTSDGSAFLPPTNPSAMANGSVTFGLSNPFFFQTQGQQTVTATDSSNPAIQAGTSAQVTVGP